MKLPLQPVMSCAIKVNDQDVFLMADPEGAPRARSAGSRALRACRTRTRSAALGASLIVALALAGTAPPARASTTELFFSEYVEGSANNKALEIYNGTGSAVSLNGYSVQFFFNGSVTAGLTINLTGTVANGDVFVLAQSSAAAAILAQADQTDGSAWFNGDDAITLRLGTTVVDSIGEVGFDPGAEWGAGATSTADSTLRRKPAVVSGDTNTADPFDPAVEWDGYAVDTFGDLGVHNVQQPNHVRPKGATPFHASLVPAYAACTSPNRTHGAPLAFGSCAPPAQESDVLTVGTPDANGAAAKSVGFVQLKVIVGNPGTPADEADVALTASVSDVRNRPDLTDYTGQLLARLSIRITDLDNPPPSGGSAAATMQDVAFAFIVPCTANVDPSIGSSCSAATTADAVSPGVIKEGMRAIWQVGQIEVLHEGPGGVGSLTYVAFARQGVFVP